MLLKRLKCALFCNKPFILLQHEEDLEEGIFRMVECPKCGLVYAVLNRKDNVIK